MVEEHLDSEMTIGRRLLNLAMVVDPGSDLSHLHDSFSNYMNVSEVKHIFIREGIRWGEIVENDVTAILLGGSTQYFKTEWEWAHLYRSRRGVRENQITYGDSPPGHILDAKEFADDMMKYIQMIRNEYQEYGIAISLTLNSGHACFKEQKYFYASQEWHCCAKAMRFKAGNHCEECGERNTRLYVHHMSPVITVYHHLLSHNFTDYKLRVLCKTCHTRLHEKTIRAPASYSFVDTVDEGQEKPQNRRTLAKIDKVIHTLGKCQFCQNRIAEVYPNE